MLPLALAAVLLVGIFLGLVLGAYMAKQDARQAALTITELRRANTYLTSRVSDTGPARPPSAPVGAPSHSEGR